MNLNNQKDFEQISFFSDVDLGFSAIISVHNTVLGPGLGGCRIRPYVSMDEALNDVLRLSEGMTYKSSLAGLNLGGGKSVIIASSQALENREQLFLTFGRWVDSLGGKYVVAEDMGTSLDDVKIMSRVTKFVSGSDPGTGGGGDPSPHTAKGVFLGIGACLERVFGSPDYRGKKIVIQGVGHVGLVLGELLKAEGANVIIADTSKSNLEKAHQLFEFEECDPNKVYEVECDVFAPCAVGAIINSKTTELLKCKIVAGAANNQLEVADDEKTLNKRGIIYAPDFAINSGGVIMCADELEQGGFSIARVNARVNEIGNTVGKVLDTAKKSGKLAGETAVGLAKDRIKAVKASST